jgi:hypothetical protein
MRDRMRPFLSEESGAITIDWIVLTGVLLGTGWAVANTVQTGLQHASLQTVGQLRGQIVRDSFASDLCSGGLDALQAREDLRVAQLGGERIDVGRWLDASGAELSDAAILNRRADLQRATGDGDAWTREHTALAALECAMVLRGLD